jgi:hypothetical protein
MPCPENFALRLIVCVAAMIAVWNLMFFLLDTFLFHETWKFSLFWGLVAPIIAGVYEAITWKPKDESK